MLDRSKHCFLSDVVEDVVSGDAASLLWLIVVAHGDDKHVADSDVNIIIGEEKAMF